MRDQLVEPSSALLVDWLLSQLSNEVLEVEFELESSLSTLCCVMRDQLLEPSSPLLVDWLLISVLTSMSVESLCCHSGCSDESELDALDELDQLDELDELHELDGESSDE